MDRNAKVSEVFTRLTTGTKAEVLKKLIADRPKDISKEEFKMSLQERAKDQLHSSYREHLDRRDIEELGARFDQ